jgi:anthranilate synthase/aminodeoxychorismate synthase-like glutamine amidotransferase
MIDNYDSFTYNIVQYFLELGENIETVRNDFLSIEELFEKSFSALVVSPGPATPQKAGITCKAIKKASDLNIPVLGICLGFQAICEVFGGSIKGKTSMVYHNMQNIFYGIPSPFKAMRYHSLVLDNSRVSEVLEITARTQGDIPMGVAHRSKKIYGVQFHPESILSEYGHKIFQNFLDIIY